MRAVALLALLATAACAAGGDWPSLARRPSETAPLPAAETVESSPVALVAATNAQPVVAGRLAEAARDVAATETRWRAQRKTTDAAATAARGAAVGSPAAAKAELERSRLDRVVAQIGDLRARLDGIAGDLALGAASGGDAGANLKQTGMLIAKVEALRAEAAAK